MTRVRPAVGVPLVVVAAIAIVFGGLEHAARILTETGVIHAYQAMTTVLPERTEDWRLPHVTADAFREPDPVLWWRPVHRAPYNAQGFKGPEVIPGRPAGLRIMCYGDSNTDGPDTGGWTGHLQAALERTTSRTFEVINAGVTGYSSHQGVRRFEEDAPAFHPDVVLVSFGWNDVATTTAEPDSAFRPPSPAQVRLQRFLLGYRLYLVLLNNLRRAVPADAPVRSRVSVDEYAGNLDRFRSIAVAGGSRLVLLTRPHREPVADLTRLGDGNWRARVPAYNDAVRAYAAAHPDVLLVDVQAHFAGLGAGMFSDECHFSPEGHREMGEWLAASLGARGWTTAR